MAKLGKYLEMLGPAKQAWGFVLLVVGLLMSVGATVVTQVGIPARVTNLEAAVQAMEVTQAEGTALLRSHIVQDSAATARIYCIVGAVFDFIVDEEDTPINPLACDGTGED